MVRGQVPVSEPRADFSPDVRSASDRTMKLHLSNSSSNVSMPMDEMLFRYQRCWLNL